MVELQLICLNLAAVDINTVELFQSMWFIAYQYFLILNKVWLHSISTLILLDAPGRHILCPPSYLLDAPGRRVLCPSSYSWMTRKVCSVSTLVPLGCFREEYSMSTLVPLGCSREACPMSTLVLLVEGRCVLWPPLYLLDVLRRCVEYTLYSHARSPDKQKSHRPMLHMWDNFLAFPILVTWLVETLTGDCTCILILPISSHQITFDFDGEILFSKVFNLYLSWISEKYFLWFTFKMYCADVDNKYTSGQILSNSDSSHRNGSNT